MSASSEPSACTFCGCATASPARLTRFSADTCLACASRLGRLLREAPEALVGVWPVLGEREQAGGEPTVRGSDGRVRELREVTAELKRELPLAARVQLAEMYGEMGMPREQVQEAGHVLGESDDPAHVQRALDVLFSPALCSPGALEQLRGRLFPC